MLLHLFLKSTLLIKIFSLTVALLILTVFSYNNFSLSKDWQIVWQKELEILKKIPYKDFDSIQKKGAVLFFFQNTDRGIYIFVDAWDSVSAVKVHFAHDPEAYGLVKGLLFMPLYGDYRWSGKELLNRGARGEYLDVRIWDIEKNQLKVFTN